MKDCKRATAVISGSRKTNIYKTPLWTASVDALQEGQYHGGMEGPTVGTVSVEFGRQARGSRAPVVVVVVVVQGEV